MVTSLIEMLEKWILRVTSWTKIMTSEPLFQNNFFQNNFIVRRPRVAIFAVIIKFVTMCIKTILKDSKKVLKELEIKYQNAIHICIYCYIKICWLPIKKH